MTDPTSRFATLVRGPEPEVALDEAALLIAAHAYPELHVAEQRARLDELAASCPEPTLEGLRHYLFTGLGFTGNTRRYADPRNSFLNDVMDRRVGIPVTLSLLTMEVGRRVGLDLRGVGMPGHFLVRHEDDGSVLDPFSAGRLLDTAQCEELLRDVHGPGVAFHPSLLAPVGPRAILARILANLRHLYGAMGNPRSLGWVLRLRAAIPAQTAHELAELAGVQDALGRFAEAADTVDALADRMVGDDARKARAHADLLRSRLN